MKQKTQAVVLGQNKLSEGIYDLWLKTDLAKEAKAGQFIGVYPKNKSTLLPRPISICEVSDDKSALRLVYRVAGKGTSEFSTLKKDESVDILGILGNGYDFNLIFGAESDIKFDGTVVLLGGGIGIPPMLELSKELNKAGIKSTVVAGYRNSDLFLDEDFVKYADFKVATEDGSVGSRGNVMDAIKELGLKPDVIMACGPMPMLRAIKGYVEEQKANGREVKAYISLEERMACGVGACLGCVCKTTKVDGHSHVNNARICTDGPVFEVSNVDI